MAAQCAPRTAHCAQGEIDFAELRKKFPLILTTHLSSSAVSLYEIDFIKPVALVFGNEHDGVSEEIRALADGNFVIPQVGMIRSLNISVACAVCLYEAYRQKQAAAHYETIKLPDAVAEDSPRPSKRRYETDSSNCPQTVSRPFARGRPVFM